MGFMIDEIIKLKNELIKIIEKTYPADSTDNLIMQIAMEILEEFEFKYPKNWRHLPIRIMKKYAMECLDVWLMYNSEYCELAFNHNICRLFIGDDLYELSKRLLLDSYDQWPLLEKIANHYDIEYNDGEEFDRWDHNLYTHDGTYLDDYLETMKNYPIEILVQMIGNNYYESAGEIVQLFFKKKVHKKCDKISKCHLINHNITNDN